MPRRLALPLALITIGCRPEPTDTVAPPEPPSSPPPESSPVAPPGDASRPASSPPPPAVAPPDDAPPPPASPAPAAPPDDAPHRGASPPPAPEPCTKLERGKQVPHHEFIGQTVAALDESGGEILCGRDPLWQLRFGTLCGDLASFHDVITVEVRDHKVRRVWQRKQYNAAFCGGYDH